MRRASLLPLLAFVAALSAAPAQAIGFGRVVDNTRLGQALNFAAFVRLEAGESIARECVFADVTVGERRLPSGLLRVTLEAGGDPNERMVRVTSRELIDEPVVTVDVSVGCNGRLSRSFVNFVDPPALNLAQSAPAETLAPQRVDTAVSQVFEAAGRVPPAAAAAPVATAPPPAPRRARVAAAAASVPATPPAPRAARPSDAPRQQRAAARTPSEPGPRLKLDPAPLVAAARPAAPPAPAEPAASAAAGTQAAAASAALSVDLLAAQMAAEQQQRLAAMEDSLRRLRAEAQATQGELASVQAQLRQAETGRYANPLVYLLGASTVLLAAALAMLWMRQRQQPRQPTWWSAEGAARSAAAAAPAPAAESEIDSRLSPGTLPAARAVPPSAMGVLPPPMPAAPPPPREPPPAPRRELSVEELIDLEQQADFFIVLGQDEAAIDLLMGHVRNTGGGSPLPYLKLLEIYARRGEREAYERVRERFNRRFNAYAPDWGANLQDGRTLEDYPEVVAQLQAGWREPAQAMRTMETLLFRRDDEAQTFELPAYRELLFVYSIARDLMQDEGDGVDLALPIGTASPLVSAPMPFSDPRHEDTLPLLTSVPEAYKQTSVMQYPVDIDLSDPPPPAEPTVTRITFDGLIDSDGRSRGGSGFY